MTTTKERAAMQQALEACKRNQSAQAQAILEEALAGDNMTPTEQAEWSVALKECGAKQAQIDRLMLEYCPDEMTPEQLQEWSNSQQPVKQEQNTITFRNDVQNTWVMRITANRRIEINEDVEVTESAKLVLSALEPMLQNATPVRTKDLTDDELNKLLDYWSEDERSAYGGAWRADGEYVDMKSFARAVIVADREKNK